MNLNLKQQDIEGKNIKAQKNGKGKVKQSKDYQTTV